MLGSYARSETMIKAGLYAPGSDPDLDQAMRVWPELDAFLAEPETISTQNSFDRLSLILRRAGSDRPGPGALPGLKPAPAKAAPRVSAPSPAARTGQKSIGKS